MSYVSLTVLFRIESALPGFESLLLETPELNRTGWVFQPEPLQRQTGGTYRTDHPTAEWVGRVNCRMGKIAEIVDSKGDNKRGKAEKFVSAHDLRCSCGNRLRDAGVPPRVISRIMRHSSFETIQRHYAPGTVQKDAETLSQLLNSVSQQ